MESAKIKLCERILHIVSCAWTVMGPLWLKTTIDQLAPVASVSHFLILRIFTHTTNKIKLSYAEIIILVDMDGLKQFVKASKMSSFVTFLSVNLWSCQSQFPWVNALLKLAIFMFIYSPDVQISIISHIYCHTLIKVWHLYYLLTGSWLT